ncbi:MAG: ACT domain-containing protein [Oscillospiraceae bacterium]
MKAVMTVIGADCIGIVAQVSTLLAEMNVNILDMSQTIMEGLFTMTMLVDTEKSEHKLEDIRSALDAKGAEMGLKIRIQRADIFTAMHRI